MSNLFGNIFGQAWAGNPHAQQHQGGSAGQAALQNTGQLGYGLQPQHMSGTLQQHAQHHAQQQAMMQQYAKQYAPKRWMIDGIGMEFEEFADTLYPEDCAEKTYLILKFKKENR